MKIKLKTISVVVAVLISTSVFGQNEPSNTKEKTRVIVTSDGEIDDECSMVRFLLYANEWDVEGIITSSSQYHWRGHKWTGDDWIEPYLEAYTEVYPNLILHSQEYPTPAYLKSINFLGNVENKGEMDSITPGSQHIVKVLLDESDNRPIWIQAWGGTNTIARALKTIEEEHFDKKEYVAKKLRFFFIWEQDETYQKYIRPHWGKYNIQTIIADQFMAIAYFWDKIIPSEKRKFFKANWMKANLRYETFGASGLFAPQKFVVTIPRFNKEIEVQENETLLQALEAADIDVMYDCKKGECGLCQVDILEYSGDIDHRDFFFSESEKGENDKLCACVSRVANGSITIDTAYRGK